MSSAPSNETSALPAMRTDDVRVPLPHQKLAVRGDGGLSGEAVRSAELYRVQLWLMTRVKARRESPLARPPAAERAVVCVNDAEGGRGVLEPGRCQSR